MSERTSETYVEPMCGRVVPKPEPENRCGCDPCGYLSDRGTHGRCEREAWDGGLCLACIHGCCE